jgi:hypothetical protein
MAVAVPSREEGAVVPRATGCAAVPPVGVPLASCVPDVLGVPARGRS